MMECESPSLPTCLHHLSKGYFGKPTKLRTEEPSMYEILSWNIEHVQPKPKEDPKNSFCQRCSSLIQKQNAINGEDGRDRVDSVRNISMDDGKYRDRQKGSQSPSKKNIRGGVRQSTKANQRASHLKKTSMIRQRPQSAKASPQLTRTRAEDPVKTQAYMKPNKRRYQSEEEKQNLSVENQDKKIQKFLQTTRWIANSAFTTYFGKPAFENYGRGNTKPTSGGLLYGNYLKSHNIQPHRGTNCPASIQSYGAALMKGHEMGTIYPYPPKVNKKDMQITEMQSTKHGKQISNPIYPEPNKTHHFPIQAPPLEELQKFGGKGIQKISRASLMEAIRQTGE